VTDYELVEKAVQAKCSHILSIATTAIADPVVAFVSRRSALEQY